MVHPWKKLFSCDSCAISDCVLRCTTPGCQESQMTFCMVGPNICGSIQNLLHVTLLTLNILWWLLNFWKICAPLVYLHWVRESKILISLVLFQMLWENGMNFKYISLDTTEYDKYTCMNTVCWQNYIPCQIHWKLWYLAMDDPESSVNWKLTSGPLHSTMPFTSNTQHWL
jgi:hypothetical protein